MLTNVVLEMHLFLSIIIRSECTVEVQARVFSSSDLTALQLCLLFLGLAEVSCVAASKSTQITGNPAHLSNPR